MRPKTHYYQHARAEGKPTYRADTWCCFAEVGAVNTIWWFGWGHRDISGIHMVSIEVVFCLRWTLRANIDPTIKLVGWV